MAEIKLFRLGEEVRELQAESARIESDLQNLIENNMEKFFGVRFLAHEYASGDVRMDSVGLDENNCPVIFEYKRRKDQNVITQGLCYLNRLFARKDEFNSLVAEKIENFDAAEIDWSMPRIICIASSYGKYDCEAIKNLAMSQQTVDK